jgi:hypothetical protein
MVRRCAVSPGRAGLVPPSSDLVGWGSVGYDSAWGLLAHLQNTLMQLWLRVVLVGHVPVGCVSLRHGGFWPIYKTLLLQLRLRIGKV